MKNNTLLKKAVIFLIGMVFMSFGVSFSIRANLGTTPISSTPYVVSLFTPLTVGNVSIIINVILILAQVLLLRRSYDPRQLIQIPISFLYGYLQDFALWVTRDVTYHNYAQQWMLCILGTAVLAVGIASEFAVRIITMPGEGFVIAFCRAFPKCKEGNVKIAMDCTLVIIATVLSLVFLHRLEGVREGTFAAALLVGTFAKLFAGPVGKIKTAFVGE